MVDGNTLWRDTGGTSTANATAEFGRVSGSPLTATASAIIAAAGDLGRLMLAFSYMEQKHATWPSEARRSPAPANAETYNFLSFSLGYVSGVRQWRSFASWAACAAWFRERLLDPTGPYANTRTIRDLINVYAPSFENDVNAYVNNVVMVINRVPLVSVTNPTAPGGSTFGNVPLPRIDVRDLPTNVNTAWDDLGQRKAQFIVLHRMLGSLVGTDYYFRSDEYGRTHARTDYGLDATSGVTYRWTNPLSRTSGWASGSWTNPEGPGRALVAAYGISTINRDGISIETSGNSGDPISATALEQICQIVAYWADYNRIPAATFPANPRISGLPFIYLHHDFYGPKKGICSGPIIERLVPTIVARVKAILAAAQPLGTTPNTGGNATTAPPPPTTQPEVISIPPGKTAADLAGYFGTVAGRGDPDPLSFTYDTSGPVSSRWAARGGAQNKWPQLTEVIAVDDEWISDDTSSLTQGNVSSRTFVFEDGYRVISDAAGVREENV